MATNVFVIDSSFKRTQIKVSPSTTLREVLEDACRLRKLSTEAYALKTQSNKIVDLSQPFRLSGLTAGAKLQLVQASRSPAVVSLALQLPESEGGGRLSDKFASSTSLWLMLRKYEDGVAGSQKKLNLTQRGSPSAGSGSGRLLYEQPCINVLGRSLETFSDLQKTLAQIGLNQGSALLRLSFKLTEKPLEEAMQEISAYFDPTDSAVRDTQIGKGGGQTISSSDPLESAQNVTTVESAAVSAAPESLVDGSGETGHVEQHSTDNNSGTIQISKEASHDMSMNGVSVYRAPTSSTPAAALQPTDESVFEPSIDHAKAHQAALQRATRNQRLLSDKELEEQEKQQQEQLSNVRSVVIRVRFPDQLMIELIANSSETSANLYNNVRQTLAASEEPFELRFMGVKGQQIIPESDTISLIQQLGFRGRVLVNFAWSASATHIARQQPSLREEYRARATELKVELAHSAADDNSASQSGAQQKSVTEQEKKKGGGTKADVEAKLKKFMGFGKR